MFKDQYQDAYKNATPSAELQQETLALMQEARDHHIQPHAPAKKWRLSYTLALASSAAAVLICTVMLSFWISPKGEQINDLQGEADWDAMDSENQFSNGMANGNTAEDQDQMQTNDEAEKDLGENSNADDASKSESLTDPYTPEFISNAQTETYKSLAAFTQALAAKTAPGYGKHYYNTRELLIVPSRLPDGARFRSLSLNIVEGTYSYSYLITANGTPYLLELTAQVQPPKTLSELQQQKEAIAQETVTVTKAGNSRTYQFGETDQMTLWITPASGDLLPDEATVDLLLTPFELERCTLNNSLLNMTY